VADLSVGQKQIVEISRAVGTNASLLIFDEPTASLSFQEKEKLNPQQRTQILRSSKLPNSVPSLPPYFLKFSTSTYVFKSNHLVV
jgi:ABC-type uncharacterized transport system ATPase subunit